MSVKWHPTIDCFEDENARTESVSDKGSTVNTVLHVPWSQRYVVTTYLLLTQAAWPYGGYTITPKCKNVSIGTFAPSKTSDGEAMNYETCKLSLTYTNDETMDAFSEEYTPSIEFMTLPHTLFRWKTTGVPLSKEEAPGFQIPSATYKRTTFRVDPPISWVKLSSMGKVNQAVFNISTLNLDIPKECCLYDTPVFTRTLKADGSALSFNVTQTLHISANSWNTFFNAATLSWDEIANSSGVAQKFYPLTDFNSLLTW